MKKQSRLAALLMVYPHMHSLIAKTCAGASSHYRAYHKSEDHVSKVTTMHPWLNPPAVCVYIYRVL